MSDITRVWPEASDILRENHVLIAGDTGSGKSVLLRHLINAALADQAAETRLIDCKAGVELQEYEDRADRFTYVEADPGPAMTVITDTVDTMRSRLAAMREQGARKWPGAGIYLFVDEFNILAEMDRTAFKELKFLLNQGRAAGVHVILTTQDPSRKGIPAAVAAQCTARIGLRCCTPIESRQIIGVSGCERLTLGNALYRHNGTITRLRIPYYDEAAPSYT